MKELDSILIFYEVLREETGHDFRPLPLRKHSKKPAVSWDEWTHDHTEATDYQSLLAEYDDHSANWGLIVPPGVVVIDLDLKSNRNGADVLKQAAEDQEVDLRSLLGHAPCVRTPSDGWHYYVEDSEGLFEQKVTSFLPGVDIQAGVSGCYVVIPPSSTEDGEYTWKRNLVTCPLVSLEEFPTPNTQPHTASTNGTSPEPIPEGKRNDTLTSIAGRLRRVGLEQEELCAALKGIDRNRCTPPLQKTDPGEVEDIAESVAGYEKGNESLRQPLDDWPEPILPQEPEPAQDFPVEILPQPARQYIEEKAQALDTEQTLVAPFVFGTMAAGIGASCEIDVKKEWKQSTNLYLLTVCPSGVGKSPALKGSSKPVVDRHQKLKEENKRHKEQYRQAKKQAKNEDEQPTPKQPPRRKAFLNDATTEALGRDLQDSPRGMVQIMDEASAWTRAMNKYREGDDREFFLRAWNRDAIETSRKTETEISVNHPHLSVLGALVPSSLQHLTPPGENEEDGFLPRILFVYPETEQTGMTFSEVSKETRRNYRDFVRDLYGVEPTEAPKYDPWEGRTGEWEPRRVTLSPDARNQVQEWFNSEMVPKQKSTDHPVIESFISKLQNHVFRFALILQVIHDVHEDKDPQSVNELNAERATKLSEFFLSHFERTVQRIELEAREGHHELKRYVLKRVLDKWEERESHSPLPYRDIQQATKDKADIRDSKQLQSLLRQLENDHCLKLGGSLGRGGQEAEIMVNPKIGSSPESDSHDSH